MPFINEDVIADAKGLFDNEPPSNASYDDETPVTVTLPKGAVYSLRSWLRAAINGALSAVQMAEMFGEEPSEGDRRDIEQSLRQAVEVDAVLGEVAPVSDYPMSDDERADLGLPEREPATA